MKSYSWSVTQIKEKNKQLSFGQISLFTGPDK